MAMIIFIEANGQRHEAEVQPGYSVMEGAIWNDVPGIEAACGGACACATCHVHVDPAWQERVGPAPAQERQLLESEDKATADSRLSCQIKVTPELDGLILRLPERQ